MTAIERDAILAGLRLLQEHLYLGVLSDPLRAIYNNVGTHDGLSLDQIDDLCMRLNVEGV